MLVYDYNGKVMFSLFPSPSGRNQMLNHGKLQKNYSRWYVIRGVFGWGSGSKEMLELTATIFP